MRGRADIAFGPGGVTRLFQQAPLRLLFPDPSAGEPIQAALVTTSGGLAGGDHMELDARAEDGAKGVIVVGAAEKLYRSTGPDTLVRISLAAGDGAWLEVLPQETIIFDGARLRRSTGLDIGGTGRILAGEMLVLGRTARGERLTRGLVRDSWEVRRDGRLVWADALHLDGDLPAKLGGPAGFGGAVASATLVLAGGDPGPLLDHLRGVQEGYGGRAGATMVNGLLLARWLDEDAARLRRNFGAAWAALRYLAAGLPPKLPRLWEI
jgi:urease accessory protein